MHGASHVNRVFFLVLVLLLVVLGCRPVSPAQLVGVGVDSHPLLDHLFDLDGVHVAVQIEPNKIPSRRTVFVKSAFVLFVWSVSSPTVSWGRGPIVRVGWVLFPLSGFFVGLLVDSPAPPFLIVRVVAPVARPPSWSRLHRHRRAVRTVLRLVPRPRLASRRPVGGRRSWVPLRPCAGLRGSFPCATSAARRSHLRSLLASLQFFRFFDHPDVGPVGWALFIL